MCTCMHKWGKGGVGEIEIESVCLKERVKEKCVRTSKQERGRFGDGRKVRGGGRRREKWGQRPQFFETPNVAARA